MTPTQRRDVTCKTNIGKVLKIFISIFDVIILFIQRSETICFFSRRFLHVRRLLCCRQRKKKIEDLQRAYKL